MKTSKFNIYHFEKIESTNLHALQNIKTYSDKDIILADIQTAGRGRLERKWISTSSENLYFSIILKPEFEKISEIPLVNITQLMAVCTAQALSEYKISPHIKWPNDILISGAKICGILSEISFTGNNFDGFVIGTGINLNMSPSQDELVDKAATSLYNELGYKVDRNIFLNRILHIFFSVYSDFKRKGFHSIKDRYLAYFPYLGKPVRVINGIEDMEGIVKDIADDGSLIIEKSDGSEKNIILGDMTCSIQV